VTGTARAALGGETWTFATRSTSTASGVASSGSGTLDVVDSTSEEVIATIPEGTADDVDRAVQAAAAAFPAWSATARDERAKFLNRISEGLAARTDEIAATISHEVGMPMSLSGMIQVGLPIGAFAEAAPAHQRLRLGGRSRQLARGARTGGRGRRHHAVELPALTRSPSRWRLPWLRAARSC